MRITQIDLYKADIPLREPFRIAVMEMRDAANVVVVIRTDEGLSGWGESSPFWKLCGETQATDLAAGADLARLIKGKDPLAIDDCLAEIDGFLKHNPQIRAAFDMALHDLLAQAAGLPLYQLLGGSPRPIRTCYTIGISEPSITARKATELAERGFGFIKLKLGTTAAEDIERVRAARNAVGPDVTLSADANQGWDVPTALKVLNAIAPLNIDFCEQPVRYSDLAGLKFIHDRSPIPITADEAVFDHHDAFIVMSAGAASYVNLKLAKTGGLRTAGKAAAVVAAAGCSAMIGSMMESRLALTAAVHFAYSQPHIRFFDLDTALLLAADPVTGGMRYEKDQIHLDNTPGLGARIEQSVLDRWQRITI